MAPRLTLMWNRGVGQLGNGLLSNNIGCLTTVRQISQFFACEYSLLSLLLTTGDIPIYSSEW